MILEGNQKRHTKSGDTHSSISPNEDHHMEHEVLFHTLFHPAVLSNQILSYARCYGNIKNQTLCG